MADSCLGKPKSLVNFTSHVTMMVTIMVIFLGIVVQCEKKEVPSTPRHGFDFSDVDTDGSGCVEGPEELQNFRLQVGRILGEALQLSNIERALRAGRITHSADVNGDGRICECDLLSILVTEFKGPVVHRHAFRVYADGSVFDDVDTDHNGVLDDVTEKETLAQKLAQCIPVSDARTVVDSMSKLDKGDGQVTKAEYMLFLQSSSHKKQPASSRLMPQPGRVPPPLPQPQRLPLPRRLPQSVSQPQFQAQRVRHPQPQSPQQASLQKHLETAGQGEGTGDRFQVDRNQRHHRKRLLSAPVHPFPGAPPQSLQPVSQLAQPWSLNRHYQLMNPASSPMMTVTPLGQPLRQPGQPNMAAHHPKPSVRSMSRESLSTLQPMTQPHLSAADERPQRESGIWVDLQAQHNPARLEKVYSKPQLTPQADLTRSDQTGAGNQPPEPQPQPGSQQSQQDKTKLATNQSNPSPGQLKSETDHLKSQSEEGGEQMKNLSDQLDEVGSENQPSPPRSQSANESLGTQIKEKN